MPTVTLVQVLNAITDTLLAATTLSRAQSYDELTDGMNDMPTLQVYPETVEQDITGNADRTTFKAGIRQSEITVHADYYARQRSHIGEDMAALVNGIDAIQNILEQQDTKPYFGLAGIKAFHWTFRRVTFVYGDLQTPYTGGRFVITLRLF